MKWIQEHLKWMRAQEMDTCTQNGYKHKKWLHAHEMNTCAGMQWIHTYEVDSGYTHKKWIHAHGMDRHP